MTQKGIDISYHQGTINFKKVRESGVDFAILREGYRKTIDKKFIEYVSGAKSAGIEIPGVYHFFYPLRESDVLLEAKSCIANVEKAGLGKDVIIFADLEYDTFTDAKEKGVTLKKSITTPWTIIFCDYVESQGYRAGVYLNQDYYRNYYDMDKILAKGYVIWLADYAGDPNYPCDYQQYSNKGKVSGISGDVDMNYFFGETTTSEPVTECDASQRQAVINTFTGWIGKKESDGSHKSIIDIYNKYLATAVKFGTCDYRVQYSDPWCATATSASFIKSGLAGLFPIECSCPRQIDLAKRMDIWIENDNTVPEPGWAVMFDWQDSGTGDNTGVSDHTGLVVSVDKGAGRFRVIEGNKEDAVGYRTMSIGGRYIRGFIAPKFNDKYEPAQTSAEYRKPSKTGKYWAKVVTQHDPLNVRQGPGTEYGLCTTFGPIPKGSTVMVCDELTANDGSTWCYVLWSGKYGFCSKKYLKESEVF